MKKIIKKHLTFILLLFLILFAGLIRFYKFYDLAIFLADQASDSMKVLAMVRGKLTLLGPISSVGGFYNGPIVYYLMLPFYWLFEGDPISGTVFQSVLSVATIPIIFLLGKKLKNETVGFVAGFLFAISPLMVDYSRAAFNAHPAVFFSTMILFMFYKILEKFSLLKTVFMGILIGFILQMHYLTVSILLFVFAYPIFFQRKFLTVKYYLSLITGIIIGLSPFILFELRHRFLNISLVIKYMLSDKVTVWSPWNIIQVWPDTIGKLVLNNSSLAGSLVFLFIIYKVFRSKNKRLKVISFLLGCVFLVGLLYGGVMQNHYIISFHAPVLLLCAFFLVDITKKNKLVMTSVLLSLLIINSMAWNIDKNKHPLQAGLSITDFKNAARLIKNDKKTIYNVAMHTQGDNRAMPLRYVLYLINESPLDYEHYAEAESLYFIINKKEQPKDLKMWEYTSFGPSKITGRWPVNNDYFLYKLTKDK